MNYFAEATPDGVNIMARNDAGICEPVALITYEDAVSRLDAGKYDDDLSTGYAIHHAVADGGARGWFDFTAQHNVIMWRWLIATVFVAEMELKNGTTSVTEEGMESQVAIYAEENGGIVIYPMSERLSMANNIEGAMIERYGTEKGTENAIMFYQAMLDADAGELTPFGRETLVELHDHFISDLKANGWPETPVAH